MPPQLAALLCTVLIVGLLILDRDSGPRGSKALWLPFVYVLLNSSRPVSLWLGLAPPAGGSIYIEGSPVDRTIDLVLLAGALLVLMARREQAGALLRRNVSILLYFSFAAFSVLWSAFPFVTFKHWTKAVCDLAMMLIIVTEAQPVAAVRWLLTRAGFILIPCSLLLCKYYPDLGRKLSVGWELLYTGVTTDKNTLGEICVIFGLVSWWCFLAAWRNHGGSDRSRRLLAHGSLVAITGWLLSMCNSMTSITSLVMVGIVLAVVSRPAPPRRSSTVHLAVAAVAGIALFALFFDPGGGMLKALGRNPTLTGRTDIWHDVLQIHINPVFGTGYESFWLGHRLTTIRALAGFAINEAHNGYLEVYLNMGWIGVSLLALLIAGGYQKITAALRRDPAALSLCLALFLATLFHSLTEAGFRMQTPSWILLLWAILAASEALLSQREPLARSASTESITGLESAVEVEGGMLALPGE